MKKIINLFFVVLIIITPIGCKTQKETPKSDGLFSLFVEQEGLNPYFDNKKGVIGSNGMVASAHQEASQVGLDILRKGGNAVDAAVAVHFALAVVHPFAGNIGGGGFAMIRMNNQDTQSLDFREKAPGLAHKDMYLDQKGEVIEGLSTLGHLASGVPGSVDGMEEMHKKYGVLTWEDCLEPAINLALKGVLLTEKEANGLNYYKEEFLKVNGLESPYFINPNGIEWKKDDLFIQTDLGNCLKRIQKDKSKEFYEGETAELLIKEMQKGGGIITHDDLENYNSVWRKPLSTNYRGFEIFSMAPPSSGGIALIQLLELMEPYNLRKSGWNTEKTAQIMIEAERRVYADRAKFLGDQDFVKVPVQELTDQNYLKKIWSDFNPKKATLSSDINGGLIPGYESNETTHFTIVDKDRNSVAITTTLNGAFGSKVVVEGAGFLMNNEMDDFSVKAGVPNMFGLVGNKANEIQPNKRMLSSMTPTIVTKDSKLFMTVGTPGGSTIITSVFQTILNVIDHQMNIQQAVNAKKFHHQWLPDKIVYETGAFSQKTVNDLLKKAYNIEEQKGTLGRMDCIQVLPDGSLMGGSDPRADNTSLGY